MNEEEKRILLENNRIIKENNAMLKELLEIARKYTDPENIKSENDNDFFMNVVANILAKKLEKKFGL